MDSLSVNDVEQIVTLLDQATTPTGEILIADRRRLFMDGLARLVGADVWSWSMTVANHDIPGDMMTTCFMDGGWRSAEEQTLVYQILSSPDWGRRGMTLVYETMMAGWDVTFTDREVLAGENEESLRSQWRTTGFEHCLLALHPINRDFSSNAGFHRRQGRSNFDEREKAIVQTAYNRIEWLHRYGESEEARKTTLDLPPRERQTLLYVLAGCSQKNIAERMGLSTHTVSDYLKELHKKFNVRSRAELQAQFFLGGSATGTPTDAD